MKQILQKLGLAVPSLVLALTAVVTVPAFAEHGSGDSPAPTTGNSASGDHQVATTTGTETDTATSDDTGGSGDLNTRAGQLVAQLKQQHKTERTLAQRQKACEAASKGLETKFTQIAKNATAFQTRITDIYNKGVQYQSTNSVTVSNWADLVAKANAAQAASASAIAALPTAPIDCTSSAPAQQVAAFKLQATTVRDDLKTYKAAVKDVLHALLSAKQATTDTKTTDTEGSNQ